MTAKRPVKKPSKKAVPTPRPEPPSLKIERTFDASPETLWSYWADPAKFAKWFNPSPEMDLVVHEYDVRVGGRVRFDMPQPDGNPNPQEGVFHVVKPYREFVSGSPDKTFLIAVKFARVGKRTRMAVTVTGVPKEYHKGAMQGWNAGFDKLVRLVARPRPHEEGKDPTQVALSGEREVVVSRVFDAPRDRVFQAHVDPKSLEEWWGPRGYATKVHTWELRPGGAWRIVQHDLEGKEHGFRGTFREVVPSERLAWTFEYEGAPGHVLTQTTTFEDMAGGKTKLTVRAMYASREDRDAMLASGMEWGMRQSYAKLDELFGRVGRVP